MVAEMDWASLAMEEHPDWFGPGVSLSCPCRGIGMKDETDLGIAETILDIDRHALHALHQRTTADAGGPHPPLRSDY